MRKSKFRTYWGQLKTTETLFINSFNVLTLRAVPSPTISSFHYFLIFKKFLEVSEKISKLTKYPIFNFIITILIICIPLSITVTNYPIFYFIIMILIICIHNCDNYPDWNEWRKDYPNDWPIQVLIFFLSIQSIFF